jgi:hypothetical protein
MYIVVYRVERRSSDHYLANESISESYEFLQMSSSKYVFAMTCLSNDLDSTTQKISYNYVECGR